MAKTTTPKTKTPKAPKATDAPKTKPLTDKQVTQVARCLALIEDHGGGAGGMIALGAALTDEGATVAYRTNTYFMQAAGIRASATSGQMDAIRLWAQKARRALLLGEV